MFENSGKIVKVLAVISFVLCLIGGAISFIVFAIEYDILYGLIFAVSAIVGGFISAVCMYALGEAADQAADAARYGRELIMFLNKKEDEKEKAERAKNPTPAPAWNPNGKIPAWQRVEMEKEAARKAAEEAQQTQQ